MMSAIGDYALIGDGRACALLAPTGSIDFLCWPRFDSDACMAALLGDGRHGFWRIAPAGFVEETARCYRGDTMILETVVRTDAGRVRLTEFMPWHDGDSAIVRIVEGLDG
jgi:GH15 family glucan-1,4-alpha-glucosidase